MNLKDKEVLLDYFASIVLQGILANPETNRSWGLNDTARYAYLQAQAMMKVRGEFHEQ